MKLVAPQGFSANGVLKGTVIAVEDDGITPMGFEEVVTLSDSKQRQRLAEKLVDEFAIDMDRALAAVRTLLVETRTTANQVSEESPSTPAKPEATAKFRGLVDRWLPRLESGSWLLRKGISLFGTR